MKDKINVAELLRNCPKGMELDCHLFNGLEFDHIDKNNGAYPIICRVKTEFGGYNIHTFTEYGCYSMAVYSKCVIFPKGKITWEGFVPSSNFKEGDIAVSDKGDIHLLRTEDSSYCAYRERWQVKSKFDSTITTSVRVERHATEEEKQKLFQAIKDNGYRWNAETKTLEKLQKFKIGDKIRHKNDKTIIETIGYIHYDSYALCGSHILLFVDQDMWELVPDKFDINTLVPFESRVLVRVSNIQIWVPTFWGKYLKNDSNYSYLTTNGCYKYCIPYEGNEHLLGTTDDCDEHFKTWK